MGSTAKHASRKSGMGHNASKSSPSSKIAKSSEKAANKNGRGSGKGHHKKGAPKSKQHKRSGGGKKKRHGEDASEDDEEASEPEVEDSEDDDSDTEKEVRSAVAPSDKNDGEDSEGEETGSEEEEDDEDEGGGATRYTPDQLKRRRQARASDRAKKKGYRKMIGKASGAEATKGEGTHIRNVSRRVAANVLTLGEVVRLAKSKPEHANKPAYDTYEEYAKRVVLVSEEALPARPAVVMRAHAEEVGRAMVKSALRVAHQQRRTKITAADVRNATRSMTRALAYGADAPLGLVKAAQTTMIKKKEQSATAPSGWRWVEDGPHLPTWEEDKDEESKERVGGLIKKQKECADAVERAAAARKENKELAKEENKKARAQASAKAA